MPTANTGRLLKKYQDKFVNNQLTAEDIHYLNHQDAFKSEEQFSASQEMQDFVRTIGPLLTSDVLHSITASFLKFSYEDLLETDKNTFLRGTTLEKVLLSYEFARFPVSAREHKSTNPLNQLKPETLLQIENTILSLIVDVFQTASSIYVMDQETLNSIDELPSEHRYICFLSENKEINLYYQGVFDKKPQKVTITDFNSASDLLSSYTTDTKDNSSSLKESKRFSLPTETLNSLQKTVIRKGGLDELVRSFHTTCTASIDDRLIDFSVSPHQELKNSPKKSRIGTAVGIVIGALGGLGAGVLITFLSGGFALPVLAILGIAAGAALIGGLIGGGIGFFVGKALDKKEQDAISLDNLNKK